MNHSSSETKQYIHLYSPHNMVKYVTPKINYESIDEGCMLSRNMMYSPVRHLWEIAAHCRPRHLSMETVLNLKVRSTDSCTLRRAAIWSPTSQTLAPLTHFTYLLHDTWCTTNVQGHLSKVKVTAWKRRLIAELLLPF